MSINFEFKTGDAIVQQYLNATERGKVARWQQEDGYTLEFHRKHDTGDPIYFRIDGNQETSRVPKIDTLNKKPSDYYGKSGNKSTGKVSVTAFRNGGKLSALKAKRQHDIEAIVTSSWTYLALMAHRKWNNIATPPVVVKATTKPCLYCAGTVKLVESGKAPCSLCYAYQ